VSNYHIPKPPTQEQLDWISHNLSYDRKTGKITNAQTGELVGWEDKDGYIILWLPALNGSRGREAKAHHIAWYLFYGQWPSQQLDHIDRDKTNNRIDNLRLTTQSENCRNSSRSNGISSTPGVSYHKSRGKYRATIGYFATEAEAGAAIALAGGFVVSDANIPKCPSQETLDWIPETYDYDRLTGEFINKKTGKAVKSSTGGYVVLHRNQRASGIRVYILAHHAAWYLVNREWPKQQIDHIDRDRSNNRIDNLRLSTSSENNRNSGRSNGMSKTPGVSYHKAKGKYRADISGFKTEAEAAAVIARYEKVKQAV
jgi:hypothetical protein